MAERYATDADLLAKWPSFSAAATEAQRLAALAEAQEYVNRALFGGKAHYYHMYRAAHVLAKNPETSVSGGEAYVTSRSFGSMSASYATPTAGSDDDLSTSLYGREALAIADSILVGPVVGGGAYCGLGEDNLDG